MLLVFVGSGFGFYNLIPMLSLVQAEAIGGDLNLARGQVNRAIFLGRMGKIFLFHKLHLD